MAKIAQEARKGAACPLCGRESYCFLIGSDPQKPDKVLCSWTEVNRPPVGWTYQGLAKDNRPMFVRDSAKQKRSFKYPELIRLQPKVFDDCPEWHLDTPREPVGPGDLIVVTDGVTPGIHEVKRRVKKTLHCSPPGGTQVFLEVRESKTKPCVEDPDTGAELQQIEYLYPDPNNVEQMIGKVVRRQWSDRRQWMEGFTKTKEVRPWYWNSDLPGWTMGRGSRPWPLYRENEAKEAIMRGEVLFVVAGEQAVEVYRRLGLVATTNQGGEARHKDIPDRLANAWAIAKDASLKPLLVIHPDFDLTGEQTFTRSLQRVCRRQGMAAVSLNPLSIWNEMPHGGDIKDVVDGLDIPPDELLTRLENAIDEAIDLAELAERNIKRRLWWNAPDSLDGELGYWKATGGEDERRFMPLTNFDLQIEKEVISLDGGGFLLQVKRTSEHHQHRLFLPSLNFTSVNKFEDTIKQALGGAIICRLNVNQMKSLLRVRLDEYHSRGGKLYRLAERAGQQADGYWVFAKHQLKPDGSATDENESLWIWNDNITGQADTLPQPQYNPPSDEALPNLVKAMIGFYGPKNIYPALLTIGYGLAATHYQEFIEKTGSFPILNVIGDGGGGKTTAGECALSLSGMHTDKAGGMLKEVTVSAAYERLKLLGGLLHCWDDPHRTPELDEFLKGLYNGKPRLVRGGDAGKFNAQKPHSALMVASNFAAGETNAATMSRLILLWFDCKDRCRGRDEWLQLRQAMNKASGAMAKIISLGVDLDAIGAWEETLIPHLPHAHSRMARSLAIILHYGNEALRLAGMTDHYDLLDYLIKQVCSMANDSDASTDSLRDFVERMSTFRSESKLGEWNMRFVRDGNRHGKISCLSIRLNDVWRVVDGNSSLAYNKQILKNLLTSAGANMADRQKFHGNEDVSKAFGRKATDDPKWRLSRCVSIPIGIIQDYIDAEESSVDVSTLSTNDSDQGELLDGQDSHRLTPICQSTVNLKEKSQPIDDEGITSTEQTGTVGDSCVDKKKCQPEAFVDTSLSTDETNTQQGLEGDLDPRLTRLTQKHAPISEPPQIPPLQVGDQVIPTGDTSWIRRGSTRLPKKSIETIDRNSPRIQLSRMTAEGCHTLQRPSLILTISKDRSVIKVRNQDLGRTDFFTTDGVQLYCKRCDVSVGAVVIYVGSNAKLKKTLSHHRYRVAAIDADHAQLTELTGDDVLATVPVADLLNASKRVADPTEQVT
ncbi:hypothetical protein [Adonisia turfae]|uniref:DUF927 domain-containing protein n=1 Tax=Adonisia turfae CCMR0081 TaxID=2292702 RepID=A0A6M0RLG0_9CYAN|nr:hypothetical protein [Adonisia turfae]NEZ56501.1 hypothetical protein [Adonisia turfae CCMR0081]